MRRMLLGTAVCVGAPVGVAHAGPVTYHITTPKSHHGTSSGTITGHGDKLTSWDITVAGCSGNSVGFSNKNKCSTGDFDTPKEGTVLAFTDRAISGEWNDATDKKHKNGNHHRSGPECTFTLPVSGDFDTGLSRAGDQKHQNSRRPSDLATFRVAGGTLRRARQRLRRCLVPPRGSGDLSESTAR